MELLYIGSGPISNFHLPALVKSGFSIKKIATRENSDRCKSFSKNHKLIHAYENKGYKFAIQNEKFDCAVIAIDTKATPEVLKDIIRLNIPILVEKPVAWHPQQLKEILIEYQSFSENILVAYNRRFYKGVNILKDFIQNNKEGILRVSIPDSINTVRQFLVNGCHMIDLINYLIPELEIQYSKSNIESKNIIKNFAAIAKGANNWQVLIDSKPGVPDNFEISASSNKCVYKLRPIEVLKIFEEMSILEPTKEMPLRRYVPSLKEECIEDASFKPGFLSQAQAFMEFCIDKKESPGISKLADALRTLELCHRIINEQNISYSQFINL